MLLYTVVVSTLIWVTQATPTGNHTCTGVVKHPVTVRVNVTEPVTYRTYTWCLKVPPRCSKYTVQLQDRVKIHTEMHNRTITVCCKGYVEIDYKCVPACPPQTECPFMHCNRTNHCYCSPGYTGLYCNEPCERGFWGEHCLKECDCPTGYTCHHLTGDCMIDDRPSKIRRTTVSDVEPSSTVSTTTVKQVITTERRTFPTTSTTTTTTTTTTAPSTTTTPLPTTMATTSSTTTMAPSTTSTTTLATTSTTTLATTSTTTMATTPSTTTMTTTPSTVATTIATEPTTPTTITRPTISSTYTKPTTQATPESSETKASTSEATTKEASTTEVTSTLASTTTSTTHASTQTSTTHVSTQTTQASPTTYSTPQTESISLSPSSTTTQKSSTLITEPSKSISSTIRTTEYTKPYRIFTESQTNPTVSTPVSVLTSPTSTERIVYLKTTSDSPETTTRRVTEPISTTKVEMSTESPKEITFASQSSSDSSSSSMTTAAPSTSETTATSNLSTRPKPEIFTTLFEYSTRKESSVKLDETTIAEKTWPKTTEVIPTTISIETTRVTTENIPKEVVTKTPREESFENMPPMIVNRKKHLSSPEKETERSVIKEIVPLQSTTSSTTETTKADEGVHHFAPMVPFPHHIRTHKPPTTSTSKTVQTVMMTVPTTTTISTTTPTTIETTQITKSPLDFLQPFKTFDISNGDNSITARPPSGDKITTQKPKETYIDNNKRLWEIFETGLNLKTTSSPIRTLPPIEITERPFEKYGDVEKPIKKSDKDSNVELATVTTTLDEKETSAEIFSKQLKYKEKYQKKVKPKVYDVTTSPQETLGTSSTDYKILKPAKYPKSSKSDPVEEQKMTEKEATTESTTPYRPSHTWYSHAREKAKIKEAMKSLKTTLFDSVKPTEAFDNESNDINLMQTAFTETSRNLREERNHKKGSIEANMINMTRPITRYVPQEITAGNEKDFTFYSNLIIIVGVSVLMLLTLVTLFWIRAKKINRNESVSPASSIVAYSTQSETVSPLMYETVYPLNGGPELMEAATFFCPTFTNHYAERINRELSELSYDHPPSRRPLKFNQYTEVSLDTNK